MLEGIVVGINGVCNSEFALVLILLIVCEPKIFSPLFAISIPAFAPSAKASDTRSLQEVFESVCKKAKISVIYPDNIANLCCGKAFKNYPQTSSSKALELYQTLISMTRDKNIDIVCDHSACSYEIISYISHKDSNLIATCTMIANYVYIFIPCH